MMKPLYLIDGMSLVFRAYHAMLKSQLKSPKGELTFALFGFVNIITSLLEKEKPENIAIVFDTAEPTFRHIRYPEYKANRDEFPEDLGPQLEMIKRFLDLIKMPRLEMHGYEADDIIGTIAKKASRDGRKVLCITSDKDYYQLVDENIKLMKPSRLSTEDFDYVDYGEVVDKFGGNPLQVIDVLALTGDSVDNVPGVKGIGEKTAIPLIQKYGSLEALYEHLIEIDRASVKNKLEQDKEMAFLSKELVTIMTTVPIEFDLDSLCLSEPDYPEIDDFFKNAGFSTIRRKWRERSGKIDFEQAKVGESQKDSAVNQENSEAELKNINSENHDYFLVNNEEKLNDLINEIKGCEVIAVDLETSSLDKNSCEIVGIAIGTAPGRAFYIAVSGNIPETKVSLPLQIEKQLEQQVSMFDASIEPKPDFSGKCLDIYYVVAKLKPLLESASIAKCGQNLKFDSFILNRWGVELHPVEFDSMLASYLLDPDMQHNLDALSQKWLSYTPVPITSLIGEKKKAQISMKDIDPAGIKDYACEDADLALKLRGILLEELKKENLLSLAKDIEFPVSEVLTKMERNGVAIDEAALAELSDKITTDAAELTQKIYAEAGIEFNIDSPKQLGFILFEKMGIPPVKKTKTGNSTDVQVLTQLSGIYPIASMILDYRTLVKLKSTYIDTLPKLVNPFTGRIHTTFNQTVASTGRLSSTDPNLQNIPIRTALGKDIRKAFVPQNKDWRILSADYSQVELRIMAYICKDPNMTEAFNRGFDIHSSTASKLYGIPIEEVNPDMRRVAKTINFGIMYGLGSFGLSQRLNIGKKEAQEIIDNYLNNFPGIKTYIDMTIKSTCEKGFAETLCGRRRHFADIRSSNRNLRTAAERAAINMPIQGTASDMMKIAMIRVDKEMKKRNLKSVMTIQVHDELVFEAHPGEIEELTSLVKLEMESALLLGDVPVVVEAGTGINWLEAH